MDLCPVHGCEAPVFEVLTLKLRLPGQALGRPTNSMQPEKVRLQLLALVSSSKWMRPLRMLSLPVRRRVRSVGLLSLGWRLPTVEGQRHCQCQRVGRQ